MTQDVTIMNKVNNRELLKKMMKHKFPEFRIDDGHRYFAIYEKGYNTCIRFNLNNSYDFTFSIKALNSKGNPARINGILNMLDIEESMKKIEELIVKVRAYDIHNRNQVAKQKQINSLNDIIIAGMLQKCPMLSKAFEAKTRSAKNFCRKTFNNNTGTLRIDAKFTIKNSSKLVKVFEALEEALKD